MRYIKYVISLLLLFTIGYSQFFQRETKTRNVIPRLDSVYDLGKEGRKYDSLFIDFIKVNSTLYIAEISTPTAIPTWGAVYPKSDNQIYFQDGAGVEHIIGGTPTYKSYSLANPGTANTFYIAGFYKYAAADANLTIGASVTQTFGTTGQAHGAHAFVVASGAGGTDLVLTVTGVSMTDAGVKNDSDSEIIVADTDVATTNQYFETTKKWLGQITYTLTGSAGTFDFNYGFVKYEDFGNMDFTITDFEATGSVRANETGLNIELLYHKATAFLYHVSAFIPNQTALISMATDYGTNNDVASGDNFAYKRAGMSTAVNGNDSEGIIIRVTTAVNNSINDASFHVGVKL